MTTKQALTDSEQEYLQFVAEPLHTISSEPFTDEVREKLRLTRGSSMLASQGKTSETIAHQAAFSFETVNTYLKSATKKLGASNRTEDIAEAVRRRRFHKQRASHAVDAGLRVVWRCGEVNGCS